MAKDPSFRITAIVAAHNEADIIGPVVSDLVEQDISVVVLDHGSTDGTRDVLEPFVRRGAVNIESFRAYPDRDATSDRFSLRRIIERKQQLATELESTWFINHDADEFRESPWCGVTLRDGIRQVDALGYNAIDFQVYNFCPTHDRFQPGDDPRTAFPYFEPGGAFDKLQIRCWKKTRGPLDLVSSAGHEAVFPSRNVFPIRFLLRHYPFRSQAHATRKLFDERRPRYDADERRNGWHVQYDAIAAGHQFVRDPAGLTRFEPALERVRLQINHRRVEALEGDPQATRLAEAAAERRAAQIEHELDARNRDVDRLEHERDHQDRRIIVLETDLDERNRRLEDLQAELDARNQQLEASAHRLDERNRQLETLQRDLRQRDLALAELHEMANARASELQLQHSLVHERDAALADTHRALHARNVEADALSGRLDERNRQLEELSRQLDERNRAMAALHGELRDRDRALAALHEQADRANRERVHVKQRLAEHERELDDRNRTIDSLHVVVHERNDEVAGLHRELDARSDELARTDEMLNERCGQLAAAKQELDDRTRRIAALEKTLVEENMASAALARSSRKMTLDLERTSEELAAARTELERMRFTWMWRLRRWFGRK